MSRRAGRKKFVFLTFQTSRTLQSTVKTFQMDLESTKLQLEDEIEAKAELQKLLIKVQEENRLARDRLEKEIESKNEEIEDLRFVSSFDESNRREKSFDVRSRKLIASFFTRICFRLDEFHWSKRSDSRKTIPDRV